MDYTSKTTGSLRFNDQTLGEEIANSVSHGIAALLSFAGLIICVTLSVINEKGILSTTSVAIFCLSFTLLYLNSCLFHSITNLKAKKILQITDHCMIYAMIAGSYTPICINIIGGLWGILILAINYICMVVGIVINIIDMHKYYKLSQALYIIAGWCIVAAAVPIVRSVPFKGILLILLGGIFYTAGVIFYNLKNKRYMHFVFHLFVIAGSVPHFIFVLLYCCM